MKTLTRKQVTEALFDIVSAEVEMDGEDAREIHNLLANVVEELPDQANEWLAEIEQGEKIGNNEVAIN